MWPLNPNGELLITAIVESEAGVANAEAIATDPSRPDGGEVAGMNLCSRRGRCRVGRSATLLVAVLSPVAVHGQTESVVTGRVAERGAELGIVGAIVELVGHGATLTDVAGGFRFDGVTRGPHTLRVNAFGYVDHEELVTVDADVSLNVLLDADPLPLDSLVVALTRVDVEGRVRDHVLGVPLYNADILVNRAPVTRTSPRGRFSLDEVWEDLPQLVSVRVFGYLPVDTVVSPREDDRYEFRLVRDPLVDRMLEAQIELLEERPTGEPAIGMPPIGRELLLRSGSLPLSEVLRRHHSRRVGRVRCVVIDEELVPPFLDGAVLSSTLPGDVERMEFLFGGAMLRIYTRDFMRNLLAGAAELVEPTYVGAANPPVCKE